MEDRLPCSPPVVDQKIDAVRGDIASTQCPRYERPDAEHLSALVVFEFVQVGRMTLGDYECVPATDRSCVEEGQHGLGFEDPDRRLVGSDDIAEGAGIGVHTYRMYPVDQSEQSKFPCPREGFVSIVCTEFAIHRAQLGLDRIDGYEEFVGHCRRTQPGVDQ